MSDYRLGDETPPIQRSPRVYEEAGEFYFKTREGKAVGPYATREEADAGLGDFIEFVQLAPLDALASLTDSLSDEGLGEGAMGGGAPAEGADSPQDIDGDGKNAQAPPRPEPD